MFPTREPVVRLVGRAFAPSESIIGSSSLFLGATNSKALIRRTKAVNSSRLARWLPAHMRLPAP